MAGSRSAREIYVLIHEYSDTNLSGTVPHGSALHKGLDQIFSTDPLPAQKLPHEFHFVIHMSMRVEKRADKKQCIRSSLTLQRNDGQNIN
jgi:hypothetical protein